MAQILRVRVPRTRIA